MGRAEVVKKFLLWTAVIFLASCASAPTAIYREDLQGIKKMAVVTTASSKSPQANAPDFKGTARVTSQAPSARAVMPFGLLGYLAGEMANEAAARAALVRYTDTLEKKLGSYNHKAVLDETFERSFVLEAATVNPKEIDKLEIVDYPEIRTGDGRAIKNYAVLGEKLGVDSVLAVDFSYGLEVWEKTLAAVVITSDVTAIRITDNVVLMNAHISSGTIEKALHTVDELMSNNARLYKIEYAKACKAIVYLIAAHLGVNLSSTGTFSWQPEDTEVTGTEGPRK